MRQEMKRQSSCCSLSSIPAPSSSVDDHVWLGQQLTTRGIVAVFGKWLLMVVKVFSQIIFQLVLNLKKGVFLLLLCLAEKKWNPKLFRTMTQIGGLPQVLDKMIVRLWLLLLLQTQSLHGKLPILTRRRSTWEENHAIAVITATYNSEKNGAGQWTFLYKMLKAKKSFQ